MIQRTHISETSNNYLKTNLSKYKNEDYEKKFTIKTSTKYDKKTLSKDETANITD